MVIYGSYSFFKNLVGYRNDRCQRCGTEGVSELFRCQEVMHFFWIPVIPLGSREVWICRNCGEPPTGKQDVRTGLKLVVQLLLAVGLIGLMLSGPDQGLDETQLWGVRGMVAFLMVGVGLSIWQDRKNLDAVEEARLSLPFPNDECAYCGALLQRSVGIMQCESCGVRRF